MRRIKYIGFSVGALIAVVGIIMVIFDAIDRRMVTSGAPFIGSVERQNLELIEAVKELSSRISGVSDQTLIILASIVASTIIILSKMFISFRMRRDEIRFEIEENNRRLLE